MTKAVIYARYSDRGQREESIEDQVRVCTEAAEAAGDEVVRVYADRAASGTTTDHRPAFAQLLADSEDARWERVYGYKVDRFARNRYDSAISRNKLKRNGVRVVSATEGINDGPDGILMEAVLEGMAEYYSAQLSQNVRRGMHGNALKRRHNGVNVYGYRHAADGTFEVDEEQARVVRMAFSMYAEGSTMAEVVEAMSPYRTIRGKPWSVQTVSKLLRNEKYVGVYMFDDVRIEDGMPTIVDDETFDRVQARLATHGRRGKDPMAYPLSGKLLDSEGNRYTGSSARGRGGREYRYYRSESGSRALPCAEVEDAVVRAVAALFQTDEVIEDVCRVMLDAQEDELADELLAMDSTRRRIESIKSERRRLIMLGAQTDDQADIAARLNELSDESRALEASLDEMARDVPLFDRDHIEFWARNVLSQQNPETILSLVSRVVMDEGLDVLRIEFVFDNVGSWREIPEDGSSGAGTGGLRTSRLVHQRRVCANGLELCVYGFRYRCGPAGFGVLVRRADA